MKRKESYVAPAVKTVEIEMQSSLLEGSTDERSNNAKIEDASLDGFDDTWE